MACRKQQIIELQCAKPRAMKVPNAQINKNEHIHQLNSMYVPFDAALLYGRPYRC